MLFFACNNKPEIQQRTVGEYLVEANFKNDSTINGIAKFFDGSGRIVSKVNYIDGIKFGLAVNYYLNGKISDSMYFFNGLNSGYKYRYDTTGSLQSISYDYYGLRMGPQIIFERGKTSKYYYISFGKEDLIDCDYDSTGLFDELTYFTTKPSIAQVLREENQMLELFAYLPNPPNCKVKYSVGLTNYDKVTKQLFSVDNNRILIDTLLPYPEKGWNYYVSSQIQNNTGTVNKLFLEEVRLAMNSVSN